MTPLDRSCRPTSSYSYPSIVAMTVSCIVFEIKRLENVERTSAFIMAASTRTYLSQTDCASSAHTIRRGQQ